MSISMALVLQQLPETTANSAVFSQELVVSVSAPEKVVDLSSDLRQPDEGQNAAT